MGKARLAQGGEGSIVNSEKIQGYSLYETIKPRTFVEKADSVSILLNTTNNNSSRAHMITKDLGIYFWCDYTPGSGSTAADRYVCYARAFRINKDSVTWGTTLTYVSTGYQYAQVLDTLPLSSNRLLVAHVYGSSCSSGAGGSIYANCKMVLQYFTVNTSTLAITVSSELVLKQSYSHSHWACFQKAPDGSIYIAYHKGGSYQVSYSSSSSYYYYTYVLKITVTGSAPTIALTLEILNSTSYNPVNMVAFCVLSSTSAILHYNNTRNSYEAAYAVELTLSTSAITKGTQTSMGYTLTNYAALYCVFKYSSTQAIGITGDKIAILTKNSRTNITPSENLSWLGIVGSQLYCVLTIDGSLCKCSISGTTFTIGEVLATVITRYAYNMSYGRIFNSNSIALTMNQSDGQTYVFSEYTYRLNKTYRAATIRGTIFGLSKQKLQISALGYITTIKEV